MKWTLNLDFTLTNYPLKLDACFFFYRVHSVVVTVSVYVKLISLKNS